MKHATKSPELSNNKSVNSWLLVLGWIFLKRIFFYFLESSKPIPVPANERIPLPPHASPATVFDHKVI